MLSRRWHRAPGGVLLMSMVTMTLLAAACGGSSSGGLSGGKTATTTAAKLFPDNFTSVCQGASQSRAKPYVKTAAGHKALYFQTFDNALQDASTDLPTDWTVQFSASRDVYTGVDLVGCGVRTASKLIKTCPGYQTNGKGAKSTVRLYSATYKVSVREATTGALLASTVMQSTDDGCPMLQSFDPGQKTADSYDTPSNDQIVAFLKPFVQP